MQSPLEDPVVDSGCGSSGSPPGGLPGRVVRFWSALLLAAGWFLGGAPALAQTQTLSIGHYQVVSSTRVGRTEFEYTLTADVENSGSAARVVSATVTSSSPNTVILDNSLSFGDVPEGARVTSLDTFKIRQDRREAFDPGALAWVIVSLPDFTVSIDDPASGLLLNVLTAQVRGSANNPPSSVVVNGEVATLEGNTFSATVALHEGNNPITAVAVDGAGAVATATVQVTVDTTPPRVVIDSPRDGAVVTEPSVAVAGVVNDVVVGTVGSEQAQVQVNGRVATVANRTFAVMDVPLTEGVNTITAFARDPAGNTDTRSINVTLSTAAAARIRIVSGDGQAGPIGGLLPLPLVVRATDIDGNPCVGKRVIFKVVQNDGVVGDGLTTAQSLIVTTDAEGLAQVQFRLGTRAGIGNNQVSAKIVGFEGEALFCASTTASTPALLVLDAGNNQIGVVGQTLPVLFGVIVVDAGNNRLPEIPITFTVKEGGGNFGGQPAITVNSDSNGRATAAFTLGAAPGNDNNEVEVNFPGNLGLPVTFVASGQLPGDPAETSVSGVVLDNSDVPVPGAICRLVGFPDAAQTDANGYFQIKPAPVGSVRLVVDGATVTRPGSWVWLQFDLVTIAGHDNTIGRPIRLMPMDLAHAVFVDETHGGTITLPEAPGFSLTIAPGSVTFPNGTRSGNVSATIVHPDKMPDPPEFGQQPRFLITIQPANALFNPPAAMCMPNLDGLPPGQKTEMYSYDHDLVAFVAIGTGTVSEDGSVICTDPGAGVVKAGWHCGGNPASVAAGMVSQVSVDKNKLEAFKGEVKATGQPTPPHDPGPFEWKKDFSGIAAAERGDIDFSTSDSGNTSTAKIVGKKAGKVILKVRYRCKSAQWSAYKDVEITVPKVQFAEDGTAYGFDNYDARKDFPAKSVEEGKTDTVKGVVTPAAGYNGLQYVSNDEVKVKIAPKDATSGNEVLTVTGVALGEALIEAKVDSTTHAKMTAKTYKKLTKTVAVTLIHEKASGAGDAGYTSTDISDADIKDMLKLVYKQAVIEWTFVRKTAKTVEFDLDKDGKLNVAGNAWMNTEMAAIRDAAKSAEDYNIFLVNNPSDGSSGFMSYNQKYGYIHPDNANARTVAHELGHGLGLAHTTPDTENIMYDFTSNTKWRLRKEQWDALNP